MMKSKSAWRLDQCWWVSVKSSYVEFWVFLEAYVKVESWFRGKTTENLVNFETSNKISQKWCKKSQQKLKVKYFQISTISDGFCYVERRDNCFLLHLLNFRTFWVCNAEDRESFNFMFEKIHLATPQIPREFATLIRNNIIAVVSKCLSCFIWYQSAS